MLVDTGSTKSIQFNAHGYGITDAMIMPTQAKNASSMRSPFPTITDVALT